MKSSLDMKNTTLCYIEKDDCYLMMHRVKKENDMNHEKWLGIGGKFESGETPFECAKREIKEETGVTPLELKYRGLVTFVSNEYGTEYMHLFTANGYQGQVNYNCNEGELVWVKKKDVEKLNIWQGDKIFLKLLQTDKQFFSLKLVYRGDNLVDYKLEEN